MADQYFSYCPETGLDTYETEDEAKSAAEEGIQEYRDNAAEGWDDIVGNVCWGKISEQATMQEVGEEYEFDGEMMDCVDYQLKPL